MTVRKTTGSSLELDVDASGGGGGGVVDQGAAGVDPWLVEVTDTVLPTNAATETKQDAQIVELASIDASLASIDGKLANPQPVSGPLTDAQLRASAVPVSAASLPLPLGAATEATLATRLSESDFDDKIGSKTEAAPATDTASSGLNGRLQRIAQRLTSLITAIGSPFQAGGSIGNTSFAATQATAANLNATVVGTGTFAVQSTETVPTTIYNGKKSVTTAGTQVALAASTTVKSVTIKALVANTGLIYVGDSNVSSADGFQLSPGDSVSMDVNNLATVFIDSAQNGEGVSYIAVN